MTPSLSPPLRAFTGALVALVLTALPALAQFTGPTRRFEGSDCFEGHVGPTPPDERDPVRGMLCSTVSFEVGRLTATNRLIASFSEAWTVTSFHPIYPPLAGPGFNLWYSSLGGMGVPPHTFPQPTWPGLVFGGRFASDPGGFGGLWLETADAAGLDADEIVLVLFSGLAVWGYDGGPFPTEEFTRTILLSPVVVATPEPTTLVLTAGGLRALVRGARRRRRAA